MRVVFEVDVDDEVAKSEKSQSWPGCRLHGCMLSSASRGSVRLGLVISLAQSDNHPLSVGIFQVLLIYIAYNSITTTVVRNKPSAHPSIHSNTSHLDPHSKVGRKKKSPTTPSHTSQPTNPAKQSSRVHMKKKVQKEGNRPIKRKKG